MKAVMPHFKGKADGKVINQVVAKLCANKKTHHNNYTCSAGCHSRRVCI